MNAASRFPRLPRHRPFMRQIVIEKIGVSHIAAPSVAFACRHGSL
jgi:hypothetical protein